MADLLFEARAVLDAAGYRTLVPAPDAQSFLFEDATILGILCVLESTQDVLDRWETLQDQFLRDYSRRLALDALKAWNSYTILLTPDPADRTSAGALFAIEEDFRGTRKIVRAGVTTRAGLEQALAPVAPLRRLLSITPEDIKERLAVRLGEIDEPFQALLADASPSSIARQLLEPS